MYESDARQADSGDFLGAHGDTAGEGGSVSPAALAVVGVLTGVPVALFLVWAVAELTGDGEEMGRVLSIEEWKEKQR